MNVSYALLTALAISGLLYSREAAFEKRSIAVRGTIVSATNDLFLRVLTLREASGAGFEPRTTRVAFPAGDLSFLHAIAPIGTKFDPATSHGQSGQPNLVPRLGRTYEATIWFRFGR